MAGPNGKVVVDAIAADLRPSVRAGSKIGRIALGLVPFTPVAFVGEDAWLAYLRVGVYGFLAYYTFNRARPISYGMMAAAGASVVSSLTAGAWKKNG